MILESVEHGPLDWPSIEVDGVTRLKKYVELSASDKLQADYDLQAINIILQGFPTNVYALVNHHRIAKDLWEQVRLLMQVRIMRERNQDPLALVASHQKTPSYLNIYQTSYNHPQYSQQFSPSQTPQYGSIHPTQHYSTTYPSTPLAITYPTALYLNAYLSTVHQEACLKPQSVPQIEYTVSIVKQQTHLAEFPQIDFSLAVPVFKLGDDPIDSIKKMMSFLFTVVTSRFPTTNKQLRNSSNQRQQATIHDGRVIVQPVQGDKVHLLLVHLEQGLPSQEQCPKPKRKKDATWFRDKVLLVEAQGSGKVLNKEELEFLADLRVAEGLVTQMEVIDVDLILDEDIDVDINTDVDIVPNVDMVDMVPDEEVADMVPNEEELFGLGLDDDDIMPNPAGPNMNAQRQNTVQMLNRHRVYNIMYENDQMDETDESDFKE
nr:hypothetical protein [Tanacetum cinerariifolium]